MIRSTFRRLTGRRWPRVGAGEQLPCSEVGRLLQHHLDGELVRDEEIQAIAVHLEACRRCGLEAETYDRIKTALADRSPDIPDDSVQRLRAFGRSLLDN